MSGTFGLSGLSPHVARVVTSTYGHHRTPWFEQILAEIGEHLRPALGSRFTPLFLTCTAAGGREAVCANLVNPGDHVAATPGEFGLLARKWGAEVTPASSSASDGVDSLIATFITHVSTTGVIADLATLTRSARARTPEAPVILDASISFGADFWDAGSLDADALLLTPERALMGIPGVTILAVSEKFMADVARRRVELVEQPFLFDLLRYHRAAAKRTTPYSPDISACVALHAALTAITNDGGLEALVEHHAARARAVRQALKETGFAECSYDGRHTNAFTSCLVPEGVDAASACAALRRSGFTTEIDRETPALIRVGHAGYVADGSSTTRQPDVEPPFTIAAPDFASQAMHNASRATKAQRTLDKVAEGARRTFRDPHVVDQAALRHRAIGFVGAGRIVRHAVGLCRQLGVRHLAVFTPDLAAAAAGTDASEETARALEYWRDEAVDVAPTLEDLFARSHVVVLLPVVYDDRALELFRRPAAYQNVGLVSAELLEGARQAGRLDLLVNAAARSSLVDREAVTQAVSDGWLRYFSDEMPGDADPLLGLDGARFTGHVGGSCREPQAAVARNTHTILRRVIGNLRSAPPADDLPDTYVLSVVNQHLLDGREGPRERSATNDIGAGRVRVLLTDPFDVESLGFDRLRDAGVDLDVDDASGDKLSTAALVERIERVRPHVVMVRSRTKVDDAVAGAIAAIDECAFIVRPGVGVDNIYAGMERLSEAGVQIINEPYGNSFAVAEMVLHFVLSGTETTLLAPGPTNFKPDVFDVAADYQPTQPERALEVQSAVGRRLGQWLGSSTDAVIYSGPGTSMMESSIVCLTTPGARGLVISHGKFGDRFVEIASARGRACEVLRVPEPEWGAAITPQQVTDFLEADAQGVAAHQEPISFFCFQQNETSSGVTYYQPTIRDLVKAARAYNPNMMVIVDAISGGLAHLLDFDTLDVDILFLGSQKALGVSSGLAFAVLSERARQSMLSRAGFAGSFDEFCDHPARESHLDSFDRSQRVSSISLLRALVASRRREAPDTPSLFHLLSTARALDLFDREGGRIAVAERHAALAEQAREGVSRLGLATMAQAPFDSNSVTVALLPEGVSASAIRKAMARETAIAVAGAQGDFWKARMIRIGTLGFVSASDLTRCLRALGSALAAEEASAAAKVQEVH